MKYRRPGIPIDHYLWVSVLSVSALGLMVAPEAITRWINAPSLARLVNSSGQSPTTQLVSFEGNLASSLVAVLRSKGYAIDARIHLVFVRSDAVENSFNDRLVVLDIASDGNATILKDIPAATDPNLDKLHPDAQFVGGHRWFAAPGQWKFDVRPGLTGNPPYLAIAFPQDKAEMEILVDENDDGDPKGDPTKPADVLPGKIIVHSGYQNQNDPNSVPNSASCLVVPWREGNELADLLKSKGVNEVWVSLLVESDLGAIAPTATGATWTGSTDDFLNKWFASPDAPGAIAIGMAEGNRNADGSKNPGWSGHTDPGNGAANIGTFSCQTCDATDPASADVELLNERIKPTIAKLQREHPDLTEWELLVIADNLVQAPLTLETLPGLLKEARGKGLDAQIEARVRSYINPATGKLEAGGFGNSWERLRADQRRRTKELRAMYNSVAIPVYGVDSGFSRCNIVVNRCWR